MSLIAIATWVLQFSHFQLSALISSQRSMDATTLANAVAALGAAPGGVTLATLTELDVTVANCNDQI